MPAFPLNLPRALPPGGTIGVVSPASPPPAETLERGAAALRAAGYRVVFGDHVIDRHGHLAGSDRARAADLHAMFSRPDIDAIICARGGSGSIRLLPHLDWDLIAANPRPFIGYSDITVLQLALLKRCRLPTFFAPMVASDFAHDPAPGCLNALWRLVSHAEPAGEISDPRCAAVRTLCDGAAEGPCVGGTLSLVVATLGTPFEIETQGSILFLEDVDESPAHVERYLGQLLLAGKLEQAAGFLLGNMPFTLPPEDLGRYLELDQIYRDLLLPLGKPAVCGWPHGHDPSPLPLPVGVAIRLDAGCRSVTVLAPAVRRW